MGAVRRVIAVRDAKQPGRGHLVVSQGVWGGLLEGVRAGR
ncbi:DUF397 domain-containing protein [Actinocorallia lasiicapitis]